MFYDVVARESSDLIDVKAARRFREVQDDVLILARSIDGFLPQAATVLARGKPAEIDQLREELEKSVCHAIWEAKAHLNPLYGAVKDVLPPDFRCTNRA